MTKFIKPYKYIGIKFRRLTVLERMGTAKNGSPIVKCICECGSIKNYNISNLTCKNNKGTISCGCYNREITASKNPWQTEYNSYIGNIIKKKKIIFALTIDQFKQICLLNCHYCGIKPSSKMDVGKYLKNGIDRVDSNQGYTADNCVPCCWTCNRMKSNMISFQFILHIKKIHDYSLSNI